MQTPIGEMREPVRILTPVTTVDESGGEVQGYGESEMIWISIRPQGTREALASQQVDATISHVAFGHYQDLSSITSKERIRLETTGAEFEVVGGPINDPMYRHTKLQLRSREND